MIKQTKVPAKSIWKKLPLLCVAAMIGINSFKTWRFEYLSQLTVLLIVLFISLISTFMWMKEDYRNGMLKKGKVILLFFMLAVTILIGVFTYFS